ncbi:hypothetical protein B0H34DRAFT_678264 [Crassisporium funariophilum]|nr:hypothetical protein B0H34DRAFT_678264 [Crassisporium funariophilum]
MCFDKPVFNTSAKSLSTKDKAEEDDSERQPFQDPLDIIKSATSRLYPATSGLKFPLRVDDNLWDNLSPVNPTLPRIDFWELEPQYTIGTYRDVQVNEITFSRLEMNPWQIIGEGNSSLTLNSCVEMVWVSSIIVSRVAGRIPVEPAASLAKEIGMDAPDDEEDSHALNPARLRSTPFSAPTPQIIDQPWERGRTRYRQPADTVIEDKNTLPPSFMSPLQPRVRMWYQVLGPGYP